MFVFESFGLIATPSLVEVVRYLEDENGQVLDLSTVAVFTHHECTDPAAAARAELATLSDESAGVWK